MSIAINTQECLRLTGLHKTFSACHALRGVDLTVNAGRLMALLGPSGCGKTTLLRLVAGFEWPDSGIIRINERVVASDSVRIAPEDRRVGMVFQDYALFPHVNVSGNVAFGLRGSAREKAARAAEMLALVGMDGLGERMPYELSGGQQQRVALARALAPRPDILLLDEPFSNLDAALRAQVRFEVKSILKTTGTTCIFVTHDQEEALSLADEVAVMIDGHIVQVATPEALYNNPNSRAVASFVGEANYLPGQTDGQSVICALGALPLRQPGAHRGAVEALIRPEALRVTPATLDGRGNAQVVWREFYGHSQRIGLVLGNGANNNADGTDDTMLVARLAATPLFEPGQQVWVESTEPVIAFAQ